MKKFQPETIWHVGSHAFLLHSIHPSLHNWLAVWASNGCAIVFFFVNERKIPKSITIIIHLLDQYLIMDLSIGLSFHTFHAHDFLIRLMFNLWCLFSYIYFICTSKLSFLHLFLRNSISLEWLHCSLFAVTTKKSMACGIGIEHKWKDFII